LVQKLLKESFFNTTFWNDISTWKAALSSCGGVGEPMRAGCCGHRHLCAYQWVLTSDKAVRAGQRTALLRITNGTSYKRPGVQVGRPSNSRHASQRKGNRGGSWKDARPGSSDCGTKRLESDRCHYPPMEITANGIHTGMTPREKIVLFV